MPALSFTRASRTVSGTQPFRRTRHLLPLGPEARKAWGAPDFKENEIDGGYDGDDDGMHVCMNADQVVRETWKKFKR